MVLLFLPPAQPMWRVMFSSCLCLSVCVFVWAGTFEADRIETFFLAQW